jgi:hypothetical protein
MLLNRQFKVFNKSGNNINSTEILPITATVIDPTGAGQGGEIRVYTDYAGTMQYVQIVNPGINYSSDTYVNFETRPIINKRWDSDSACLGLSVLGEITSFNFAGDPTSVYNTLGWPIVANTISNSCYLPPVSAGLIESENIFIIEKILDSNGNTSYVLPRIDLYTQPVQSVVTNGSSATLEVENYQSTGIVNAVNSFVITGISPAVISQLSTNMTVLGNGILSNTLILEINVILGEITLSRPSTSIGITNTYDFYIPHNLKVGSPINVYGGPLAGSYTVTQVLPYKFSFDTLISTTVVPISYAAIPQFEARIRTGTDPEWFLYEVEYGVDYPTIKKSQTIIFTLDSSDPYSLPDAIIQQSNNLGPNGEIIRQVFEPNLLKAPLQINFGLQADVEGVYAGQLEIVDVTYVNKETILFSLNIEGEIVAEDERLGSMLENLGRDITTDQELILRDSDVNEDNPDYILLNEKRKEMLLQGDQIWPYVGAYKGLVNIINWFGYYDIRIKEYWLNVNVDDAYYNKYRQVPIAFQLKDKTASGEQIGLLPSKHYKKSNLFGLFYDIVRDSAQVDEYGIPVTEDAFAYTNEEVLIKLFALKGYLKQKFLPLNTRIVDITGEGVYYERYAVNTWNDRTDRHLINAGKRLNFTNTQRSQIVDLRPYNANGGLLTPEVTDSLSIYADSYDISDVIITYGGSGFFGEIPLITFPGSALQQARGECKVRAEAAPFPIPITGAIPGINFQVGDIITLKGGTYDVPIRLEVAGVNLGGGVTDYVINAGPQQGSNYRSLPTTFAQSTVLRPVGNQYEIPLGAIGFTIDASQISFEVEEVTLYDKGLSYGVYPTIQFLWNSPLGVSPTGTLVLTKKTSSPVSYFSDSESVKKYSDSANIPIGAIVDLNTSFDVTWDELPFPWLTFTGSNNATLKAYGTLLPSGGGNITAVEIINPGSGYNYAPVIKVAGGGGYGATFSSQIRDGKLNIVEYTVSNVGTWGGGNDLLTLSPSIPVGGLSAISIGRIVKGLGLPEGTVIGNIIGNDIYLEKYDASVIFSTIQVGAKIYVHQGVGVTFGGFGYTSEPLVYTSGGHTTVMYTWDELGRADFYQMEWKATLTSPTDPTRVFQYRSGVNTIDELIRHTVILPYTGKYTIELDVYDTTNSKSNNIKRDAVEVYVPEADFAFISKNVDDSKDTWDEFAQIQAQGLNPSLAQIQANVPIDAPNPIRYDWDNANSSWVNITFNPTRWMDCDVNWDTLVVTDLSDVNNPSFPPCNEIEVLQISSRDLAEGVVLSYSDNASAFPSVNPTIVVAGQIIRQPLDPSYDPTDWIYIRRDGVIYQLEVISADYSVPGQTSIELAVKPPQAFIASPSTWEVLREIEGTVAVKGNQIYDETTNPNGFKTGEYLVLTKEGSTPISSRNVIRSKDPDDIFEIAGAAGSTILNKKGAYGRIYKVRDNNYLNGNLNWSNNVTAVDPLGFTFTGFGAPGPASFINVPQTSASGGGVNSMWNIDIDVLGNYTITLANGGSGFSIAETVFIDATAIGGVPGFNDITITVNNTVSESAWMYINTTPNDPEKSDHIGQLVFNTKQLTCNPIDEIRPGFTRMRLYVYDGVQEIYTQVFRTKHAYLNTSSTTSIFQMWNAEYYTIDVIGLNGGELNELNTQLNTFYNNGNSIYLEYEYDDFTTRQRWAQDFNTDLTIIPDYNSFPPAGAFSNATNFGPAYEVDNRNWFYDHGIVGNSYSMKILNTGTWKGGVGTLLTLDDNNLELYRSDTYFHACQQRFDEDYAERHLGTRVQTWENYEELTWDTFSGNTFDTLDYVDNLWCGYVIDTVDTNGGIKFNELPTFNFVGIVGGMSDSEKFAQALWELNNSDNPGISKFNYGLYSATNNSLLYIDANYVNDNYFTALTGGFQYIGKTKINTYLVPDGVFYENSVTITNGDVLYSPLVEPASKVTSIAPAFSIDPLLTNYNVTYLNKNIPKKGSFVANGVSGSYRLKNIQGLHEGVIRVGEVVSGVNLPVAPAIPATVLEIFAINGMVREIVLSQPLSGNVTNGSYVIEQITLPNATITIPFLSNGLTQNDIQIFAFATNPSVDNLGYLVGTNGVTFLPPQNPSATINTSIAHTYPMNNFYQWFGFGDNKVGSFEYGLQQFLTKYRYAQTYINLGTAPWGVPGWYPADNLPYKYSYTNDPIFSNYLEAKSQSERLPYARAIGGSYTWDETRIGKYVTKIPSGSSVMLSAEASDMVGKTGYLWKLKDGNITLAETIDSRMLWTFDYTGAFDVELTITDTNGNQKTQSKKSFLNVYEAR